MWTAPYVLLDDAAGHEMPARLYRDPIAIVRADTPAEIAPALERLRAACAGGLHAAGYLAYEAGAALAARPIAVTPQAPLLWFGLFEDYETIPADALATMLPDPAGAWAGTPRPDIDRADYDTQFARVRDLIAAGDIYQANLSLAATIPFVGDPLALYARLRCQSRAGRWHVASGCRRSRVSIRR